MKKKILTAVLIFAVTFTICGCYARVKDRNELIKYANETYGEAKFLGSEKKLKGKESFTTILLKVFYNNLSKEVLYLSSFFTHRQHLR